MLIIEQSVNLIKISKSHSLIGIVEDKDLECVLITLSETVAIKYHVRKRIELCQWKTKYLFRSNVAYDWIQCLYVGHFENNILKVWPETESFIDCVESLKFNVKIHGLISNMNDSPFVLFENGYASKLNEIIGLRKDPFESNLLPKYDKILCFDTLIFNGSKAIFGLLVEQNNTKYVIKYELNNNNVERFETFAFQQFNVRAEAIWLFNGTFEMSLFILGSNKKLYNKSLRTGRDTVSSLVADFQSSFENEMATCRIADSNAIAVYGQTKNRTKTNTLVLYNLETKSVERQQQGCFKNKNKNDNYNLWNVRNNLFYVRNLMLKKSTISNRKQTFDSFLAQLHENNTNDYVDARTKTIYVDPNHAIFRNLLERNDTKAIEKQIDHCTDLLEPTLVQLVGYAVRNYDLQSINHDNYTKMKCRMLNKLLMFKYDCAIVRALLIDEFADQSSLIVQFVQYLCLAKIEIKVLDWTLMLQECFACHHNGLIRQFVLEIRNYYVLPSHTIRLLNEFICGVEIDEYPIASFRNRTSNEYRIEWHDFNLQFD